MNRKFIYSLLTLTSLLAVYQLYLHVHEFKPKVNKQLTQTNDVEDEAVEDNDIHDAIRNIPASLSTEASQFDNLFIDEALQRTQPLIEDQSQHPQNILTLRAKGRLGNHMFQYASMLGIAHKNNLRAYITGESKVADTFQINTQVHSYLRFTSSFIEYEERKGCVFEPEVLQLGSTYDILLKGYFQSWKYFDFYEKDLREQFRWNVSIAAESKRIFESLIPQEQRTYVGVHVRRGDMIYKAGYRDFGYVAADLDYILRAMNYFRTKIKDAFFIVASDDYIWCKDNIKGNDVKFTEQTIPEIDMAILTLCNHTIMTVGSFGWWAAWLTGGETVYFKDFPRSGSKLDDLFKADDYWMPSWIPM